MNVGFKTVSLVWINKTAVIGYTWLFVYRRAYIYVERIHVAPELLMLISGVIQESGYINDMRMLLISNISCRWYLIRPLGK